MQHTLPTLPPKVAAECRNILEKILELIIDEVFRSFPNPSQRIVNDVTSAYAARHLVDLILEHRDDRKLLAAFFVGERHGFATYGDAERYIYDYVICRGTVTEEYGVWSIDYEAVQKLYEDVPRIVNESSE